ncbi:LacI family DNA-binding transcriptional regulator [Thalassobacter stenotrophicus]|uniref:DNA-binding transcriptional regulator, LacI/PurR family n=3 Tax=Thalassobacter stenotrophicus TaxID=266809 RepID=A0ABY1I644_9RHOB|nr:LacI family DNA-binding transcriptional regulator [Thalassobacter stenotrophicus]PVZ48568.1 LacI family DNA-binding transcriptional regulator [Thalassobacter stenotrophicus]CUH61388.1 putative galacturonate locus repressor [Thalassobacter stenotrophicus]SHI64291.1 DNA-binding transcriptional regulator, LacI/PurR family [Thalassobacter stenotrophicus DSM 16310]
MKFSNGLMKKTAKDVADLCGTSTAAVSRAFRAESTINTDLRRRILATAREMGYAPPAKRMRGREGRRTISIVVGDISNPFYASALETFAAEIGRLKYEMLVHVVAEGKTVDSAISQVMKSGSDAAIIASANLSSELAQECKRRGIPVVLFNRVQADPNTNAICTDNYNGGMLAAKRFVSRNCASIGFVGGVPDTSTHLERRRGFLDELARHDAGLSFEGLGQYDYGVTFNMIRLLLDSRNRPEGLFCANDIMAIAAIDAARLAGMVPGKDISIIGFDDVPMAAWTSYQLTTFRQRIRQMVSNALSLVEEIWQEPDTTGALRMVRCGFIERQSG